MRVGIEGLKIYNLHRWFPLMGSYSILFLQSGGVDIQGTPAPQQQRCRRVNATTMLSLSAGPCIRVHGQFQYFILSGSKYGNNFKGDLGLRG